jgi:fructose/tagatose bisphosphate aldolase
MAVVPIRRILDPAFAERCGVAVIKVVDDLTLEAVLAAATELDSPLTLVKLDDELNDRFDAQAEVAARIFQW